MTIFEGFGRGFGAFLHAIVGEDVDEADEVDEFLWRF